MHALIQVQNIGEFWLVDLGSSNGTFLNKRRVHQPVRLHDQDKIFIGGRRLFFGNQTRFHLSIRLRLQSEQ
jgi:adenylate cyclase